MYDALVYIAIFVIFIAVTAAIYQNIAGPRCRQCRTRVGKRGIRKSAHGVGYLVCINCDDQMRAHDGVPDFDRMNT